MNGVEILTSEEVVVESVFSWSNFWIALGVFFGIFLIAGIIVSLSECNWLVLLISCIVGLPFSSLFGAFIGSEFGDPAKYETQYKLTISDNVSMNEFMEKYEIIDQEGKIYTVRERNV